MTKISTKPVTSWTNVTGTIYLIHKVGRGMRAQGDGRILITGSIAGFMPGSYQAVYNGTKAMKEILRIAPRVHESGALHRGHVPSGGLPCRDRGRRWRGELQPGAH